MNRLWLVRVALCGQRVLEWALACMDNAERQWTMLLVFDRIFSTRQKERLRGAQAALAEYLHQYNKCLVAWKDHFIQPAYFVRRGKK